MIKYKYLYAWDRMMRSTLAWSEQKQRQAEMENAPIDCIYRDTDGTWHIFGNIENQETKNRIQKIVDELK